VGLPLVIILVYVGGLPLLLMSALLSLIGLRELYVALHKQDKGIHGVGYVFTILFYFVLYLFGTAQNLLIVFSLLIIVAKTLVVLLYSKWHIKDCAVVIYGFFYVSFLLSFTILVREHAWYGSVFVWLIFTSAFGCDTFAYLTGTLIGKHKLKNSPSPKKSVEGLIGGVLGATGIGVLYGFLAPFVFGMTVMENFMLYAAVVSFACALFSIVGDMSASAVKRYAEIKDFGNLFPGHGGVLDRMDSLLFVAPIIYLVINMLQEWVG
jgi:phosphatidate cytidylyltransferase